MTEAETISNAIAAVGLIVALVSVAIAGVALRRTGQAEKREREAIVVVRMVWCGTPGIEDSVIPGVAMHWITADRKPVTPEQRLVISMDSANEPSVFTRQADDGVYLELRPASPNDMLEKNGPGGHNTHYVVLEVQNVGRRAAVDMRISCTIAASFASYDPEEEGNLERSFSDQLIAFEALAPDEPRYVEIRNMTGLPVTLDFDEVSAGNDEPIRLAPAAAAVFQPRGYRS